MALAEILKAGADREAVFRECTLRTSVDDLKEELAHSCIDRIANEVCVQGFQNGEARKDLRCHSRGMRHAGAADCLNKSFLNNTVLHVQRQLAGALLRSAPAHAMCIAGDVLDLPGFHPLCLFRNRSSAVMYCLGYRAHFLDLC